MGIKESYNNIKDDIGTYELAKDVVKGVVNNTGLAYILMDATLNSENYLGGAPLVTAAMTGLVTLLNVSMAMKYKNLGKGKEV